MGDNDVTLKSENFDISMKTKLFLKRLGGNFGKSKIDEKSILKTLLSFTPYWNYKPTNANHARRPNAYGTDKILNLSTKNKIHLKCSVIDGLMVL